MDSFEILAEVAIGIAGFGSIAIVLGRDGREWEPADFFRTSSLFLASFGALFLALLPVGLATTGLAPEWIWRLSSAVMLAYIATFSVLMFRWRTRYLDRSLWFGPIMISMVVATTVANIVAQVMNVGGFAFEPGPACYFFGIIWFLLYSCTLLMRIVFIRPDPL